MSKASDPDLGRKRDRLALATATLAEVNRGILAVARGGDASRGRRRGAWESAGEQEEWEFFCECARIDCDERVFLTLDAYVALRDGGGAVLAPGHRLSQIERARRLRAEADALNRQAEHQVKRAKQNTDDGDRAAR